MNGKMNGKGKFNWPDGKIYEGDFVNDIKEGTGTLFLPNGKIYKNQWKNDQMNGIGTVEFNGTIKKSEWIDG